MLAFIANGAQSAVYRCFTEETETVSNIPFETAIKIYFNPTPGGNFGAADWEGWV